LSQAPLQWLLQRLFRIACSEQPTSATQQVVIRTDAEIGLVRPEFHGQFIVHLGSCVYGGLWVGKNSHISNINGYRKQAVEYLKDLGIPVLRWPDPDWNACNSFDNPDRIVPRQEPSQSKWTESAARPAAAVCGNSPSESSLGFRTSTAITRIYLRVCSFLFQGFFQRLTRILNMLA
jgi:hypothetical protein